MRLKGWLSRMTVAVWVLWLSLVGLLAAMVWRFTEHPHFFPVTALLTAIAVAWVVLVAGSVRGLIRGPERTHPLTCLLLGTTPVLILASHILYGLRGDNSRIIEVDDVVLLLVPLGESVMDLEARVRYPLWTSGEKVVMISKPLDPSFARAQVAAMDQHIKALETRLGRTMPGKVHWVRGPLLGKERHALYALCLGTKPGEDSLDDGGLATVDRHEVAHCVITLMGPSNQRPPALLSEGWAEANEGLDEAELLSRAAHLREKEGAALRELTGPDWYSRHQWLAYCEGAPLTNYLLKTYGPERFFKLYMSCQAATFNDDCPRILGADLDRLDADFQAVLDRHIASRGILGARLASLRTGPKVDPVNWLVFLDEYVPAATRLLAPYNHVRMITEQILTTKQEGQPPSRDVMRFDSKRSGPFASLAFGPIDHQEIFLATPTFSAWADRNGTGSNWEIGAPSETPPDRAYRDMLNLINSREPAHMIAATLLTYAQEMDGLVDTSTFKVTALERFTRDDRKFVRIRIEDERKPQPTMFQSFTIVLAADDLFAIDALEYIDRDGEKGVGEYRYEHRDGVPILTSSKVKYARRNGQSSEYEVKVVSREFGVVPGAEFKSDQLFPGATIVKSPDPYADGAWQVTLSNWYRAPLITAALCLVAGTAAGGWSRSRGIHGPLAARP